VEDGNATQRVIPKRFLRCLLVDVTCVKNKQLPSTLYSINSFCQFRALHVSATRGCLVMIGVLGAKRKMLICISIKLC